MDIKAMYNLSYGLFVLAASENGKDAACIINTATQVTTTPNRITIAVNKQNATHDVVHRTGAFALSVLDSSVPFATFQHFGFQSSRDVDKFHGVPQGRSPEGAPYLTVYTNAWISAKVVSETDLGTHTLFLAEVTDCGCLSDKPSVTYAQYQNEIKPKPAAKPKQKGWVCKVCGYVYEGETLPPDFVCPLCKHGAEDFEPLG